MMMDVEYDAASSRFSKERKAEQKRDSARKSREAAEKAKSRAQQALWEREGEARREQEALRAAEQARIFEADMEANRGVVWSQRLVPVLSLAGESKGIVRRADKISLPYSAKVSLEEQQASKNGQLFFELSTADGRRTHAAILDYSAAEGTVGAPPELLRCLGLSHLATPEATTAGFAALTAPVAVAYRRLEKGTFAMLQPLRHSFHDVGDVKALLEGQLQRRATLTKGDEVTIFELLPVAEGMEGAEGAGGAEGAEGAEGAGGAGGGGAGGAGSGAGAGVSAGAGAVEHTLRVLEVRGEGGVWEGAVSLLDTDMEVEVAPSVEREEAQAAQEAERQRREEALAEAAAQRRAADAAVQEEEAAAAAHALEQAAASRRAREERRAHSAAVLAAAPEAEAGAGSVQCVVRCPDGSRCVRRMRAADGVSLLFALVEAEYVEPEGGAPLPAAFSLAAQFPRRVLLRPDGGTAGPSLAEAGLSSPQESLVVELPHD